MRYLNPLFREFANRPGANFKAKDAKSVNLSTFAQKTTAVKPWFSI